METPDSDNLKAQMKSDNPELGHRLENVGANLKSAYKLGVEMNRNVQQTNKRLYDRNAEERSFKVGDLVYLYSPAIKPGLSRKFHRNWAGPFKVTRKTFELNYVILSQNMKQIVHINRLKKAYCSGH
jgi:hypothetical protein